MKRYAILVLGIVCCACGRERERPAWSADDRKFLVSQLEASSISILEEIQFLNDDQWNWREDAANWSIGWVVEHVIVHDELFYREMRVLTELPTPSAVDVQLFASDEDILSYSEVTPQNIGKSPAYLEPRGRWCSNDEAIQGFRSSRSALTTFITNTQKDLRSYYTTSGRGPTAYRDLHQLMLISIAHTERHLHQIRRIKSTASFPQ